VAWRLIPSAWELNPEGFRPGFDHVAGLSDRDGTVVVAGQVEEEAVERVREEYLEGVEQEN
jgi:hypothetical protein